MPRPKDRNQDRNIVGPTFESSGQPIATIERNISQHCWLQHVARVWPHVAMCCAYPGATLLHEPGQKTTTSCKIHKCCMKNLTIFKFGPTTPNMLQQGGQARTTCCDQQCCDMLRWEVAIVWPGLISNFLATASHGLRFPSAHLYIVLLINWDNSWQMKGMLVTVK